MYIQGCVVIHIVDNLLILKDDNLLFQNTISCTVLVNVNECEGHYSFTFLFLFCHISSCSPFEKQSSSTFFPAVQCLSLTTFLTSVQKILRKFCFDFFIIIFHVTFMQSSMATTKQCIVDILYDESFKNI